MGMSSTDFIKARIAATESLIVAYEAALEALSNGVLSYTLDTGQGRQTVTRQDVGRINDMLDGLYNRYVTLCARIDGSGVLRVRPNFP